MGVVNSLATASTGSFVDPWKHPLSTRLSWLKPGTIRVGYFYEVPDPGSFRYRAYNMAQTLNGLSHEYSASYFFLSDLALIENFPDYIDVFVLVRFRFGGGVGRLIGQARSRNKTVLFDIDDLIFDWSHTSTVASSLNFGLDPGLVLDNWYALSSRLGHTLRLCDGAITTTPTLQDHIEKTAGVEAHVVPNFLNAEQVSISAEIREAPPAPNPGFTIGYFSGSKSHARDFDVAAGALAQFLSRHPDARLVVAGILEIPDVLNPLWSQIDRLPFMDYLSLQSRISEVDLNIVPLQDNPFTDGKSELKYVEASAVSTLTLASPAEVFSRLITDGHNGFLAAAESWLSQIELVASLKQPQRKKISHTALRHVVGTYTPEAQVSNLESVLGRFVR